MHVLFLIPFHAIVGGTFQLGLRSVLFAAWAGMSSFCIPRSVRRSFVALPSKHALYRVLCFLSQGDLRTKCVFAPNASFFSQAFSADYLSTQEQLTRISVHHTCFMSIPVMLWFFASFPSISTSIVQVLFLARVVTVPSKRNEHPARKERTSSICALHDTRHIWRK